MFARAVDEGKKPRRVGRRQMFLLLGGVILIGGALLVVSLLTMRPAGPHGEYSPPNPPVTLPTTYHDAVMEQVAQGLSLSVAQVKDKLHASPGQDLFSVAQAQGVSRDHLYTLTINAFQSASDQMVRTGQWTQQQGNVNMQYWRQRQQKALIGDVTGWLLNG